IGTFMIARAIFFHGLDRRFALTILSIEWVGEHPIRLLGAYALCTCAISMWISNTATTAMMFPMGLSLRSEIEKEGNDGTERYASALLLVTSLAASIGGLGTPVGTPPNLIGIGFLRREASFDVPFFSWMALGVPIVAVLLSWIVFHLGKDA